MLGHLSSWRIVSVQEAVLWCGVLCFRSCTQSLSIPTSFISLAVGHQRSWLHMQSAASTGACSKQGRSWRQAMHLGASLLWPLVSGWFCPLSWHWWKFLLGAVDHYRGQNQSSEGLESQSTANDEVLEFHSLKLLPVIETHFEKAKTWTSFYPSLPGEKCSSSVCMCVFMGAGCTVCQWLPRRDHSLWFAPSCDEKHTPRAEPGTCMQTGCSTIVQRWPASLWHAWWWIRWLPRSVEQVGPCVTAVMCASPM